MPQYEYECPSGHRTVRLRKYDDRDVETPCKTCQSIAHRVVSIPHCVPDGMYSYAPNIGTESSFVRRIDAMRNGQKVLEKEAQPSED